MGSRHHGEPAGLQVSKGGIFPVNRHAERVFGLPAYPHVSSIPGPVDLAILIIPEDSVEEAIHACGKKGVKGIIIITAGFGEATDIGRGREEAMARVARSYGMRTSGPNVSGTFNLHARFNSKRSHSKRLGPPHPWQASLRAVTPSPIF